MNKINCQQRNTASTKFGGSFATSARMRSKTTNPKPVR